MLGELNFTLVALAVGGTSIIHRACFLGDLEIVKTRVTHGAHTDKPGGW